MRLFVGLDLPDNIKSNLGKLVDALRPTAKMRWSPVANLHITTKFIGEWPEARLPEMKAALNEIKGIPPFTIDIRGLGWFPNPHRPRVFWAAVRAPEQLVELAAATEAAAFSLGVARETRAYSPHLTLARMPEPALDLAAMRRAVAALPSDDFGAFDATAFHLYLSKMGPGGSVYSKLATFPLE
ncbi:MAG: RNA 2',3'-cyclic phosphodiesterase [Acidobacteria bacterium]|nr:RNA 2',3'-cyclic phosphodiesterase [Acidobacteriota bacterium]